VVSRAKTARIGEVQGYVEQTISELARQGVLAPPGTYSKPSEDVPVGPPQEESQSPNILRLGQQDEEVDSNDSGDEADSSDEASEEEVVEEGPVRDSGPGSDSRRVVSDYMMARLQQLLDDMWVQKKDVDN